MLLQLKNLVCGYDGRAVIAIPDLNIAAGEVIAVVGRSGGGKTTLLSTLDGSNDLVSGTISADGAPVTAAWLKSRAARTIQSFPLLHWLTVRGNLKLCARIKKVKLTDEEAERLLAQFAASHLIDRFPKELSGGERARASLAQAALGEPRLLLLDEPLTGLDPLVKTEVADALFGFAKKLSAAVLFVTHDLYDAAHYTSRVAVLSPGPPSRVTHIFDSNTPDIEARMIAVLRGEA